jgi:hypothetical protein
MARDIRHQLEKLDSNNLFNEQYGHIMNRGHRSAPVFGLSQEGKIIINT